MITGTNFLLNLLHWCQTKLLLNIEANKNLLNKKKKSSRKPLELNFCIYSRNYKIGELHWWTMMFIHVGLNIKSGQFKSGARLFAYSNWNGSKTNSRVKGKVESNNEAKSLVNSTSTSGSSSCSNVELFMAFLYVTKSDFRSAHVNHASFTDWH